MTAATREMVDKEGELTGKSHLITAEFLQAYHNVPCIFLEVKLRTQLQKMFLAWQVLLWD